MEGVELRTMSRAESLALLASVPVGRVIFTVGALPAVEPVNFVVVDESVVIRTSPGAKLVGLLRDHIVAFEADEIDAAAMTGWSVTVVGFANEVGDAAEIERLKEALTAWAPGEREHFLKIGIGRVTGRRLSAPTDARVDGERRARVAPR